MPKKQLLPPSGDSRKREVSVNLRFSVEDHQRLKYVADFSGTTVASLLHYVTIHTTLPMMEQEVRRAHVVAQATQDTFDGADIAYDDSAFDTSEEAQA